METMEWSDMVIDETLKVLAYVGVYAVLFLLAKQLKDVLTPYKLLEELAKKDNPAVGLSLSGYLLATAIIFVGPLIGPSTGDLKTDLMLVAGYSLLGLLFLNLSRWSLDKLVFHKFCNITAIVEDRNLGMGAVRFGVYVATGLIAAASLNGQGGGPETAVAFFALGQVSLIVFARLYDVTTPYALQHEVEMGNTAAGVAFGGTIVALGVIIAKGVAGDFVSWEANLLFFVEVAVIGMVILQVVRVFMDKMILTGHDLNKEISEDRNLAAGFLEVGVANSFAIVLAALL